MQQCVYAQAQWAEAISHENEKLHQLSELQRGIIADLRAHSAPNQVKHSAPSGATLWHSVSPQSALHAEHPNREDRLAHEHV